MNTFSKHTLLSVAIGASLLFSAGVSQASPFWAQVPGVNVTAQNLDWETLTSNAYSDAAVAASATQLPSGITNTMHVFYRDQNKCLQHLRGNDRGQDFVSVGQVPGLCDTDFDGQMTAISWDNSGRIDIFWFNGFAINGAPFSLMHRWTDGTSWYNETVATTASTPASAPTVASWGTGHLDVFWRDTNNQLRWLGFDRANKGKPGYTPNGWFNAERVVGNNVTGDPTAVERTTNIIDLFWRDASGQLQHRYNNTGVWSNVIPLGVTASTAPSATSWGTSRIDVVYGVDASHLGHLWIDGSTGTWAPSHEKLTSSQSVGWKPTAVAARSHAGRLDVFTSPSFGKINHTLYQNSLPGFAGVSEGNNGGNGVWCSESAAISVINDILKPKTLLRSCDGANVQHGMTTCCTMPLAPAACRPATGGSVESILDGYHLNYQELSPLSLASLQLELWTLQQPVISHHSHPDGSGHYVVLVDTYRLNKKNMVVIFGTQFDANWVVPYDYYLQNHYATNPQTGQQSGWKVDGMVTNFHK